MLAIVTHNGTNLVDPVALKNSSGSFHISSSLECSTSVWSPDNSQLYLADSSSVKRYTPSECLLEELYHGSDTVTCLETKDEGGTLFFATANKVWSLDCTRSPGRILFPLEPHKDTVTRISLSIDGTLLASMSASAVFVHNLTLASYMQLKGLPSRKPVTCCRFHRHFRTRLLLSVGQDVVVYDSMRPSSPLKVVHIPGGGDIVGISASPFSKTLIAAATSNGDVALVDLDKEDGILKTVNVKNPLTCCTFTAEGAAVYLGTESGKLLVLDLRSLEKEPRSFTMGDDGVPIKAINVQWKPNARVKAMSSSVAIVRSSPQRSASPTTRKASTSSGPGARSPEHVTVVSKIRGGGGITSKKKLFSPARAPLSETQNLDLGGQLEGSYSPTLSRRAKLPRLRSSKEQGSSHNAQVSPYCGLTELTSARERAKLSASDKTGQVERLGLGPAPESISGHLAAMRVRSGPLSSIGPRDEGDQKKTMARRIVSESAWPKRPTSTGSAQRKVSSSKVVNKVGRMQQKQEQQSRAPDDSNDSLNLSSPELPHEPVTPISNVAKAPLTGATGSGLTSPEIAKSAKGESQKGKGRERVTEVKKARFTQHLDIKESSEGSEELEDAGGPEFLEDEQRDEGREQELSLQVSPRRPAAPPAWLRSPHRPSAANLNMNVVAQDFLRNIVHDVMYDFQRETKAEMMGLHLDLVRMGRGWKQELREVMEEWNKELKELKAENRRLREENERLRRGY